MRVPDRLSVCLAIILTASLAVAVGGDRASASHRSGELAPTPAIATLATVDTEGYSGFENAIFAANRTHVFVAYKRFSQNPAGTNGAFVPASLCVARSVDSGRTWHVVVVDRKAGETGDTIDDSVAFGGAGRALYVAYLAQASEASEARLKLAKSIDGGKTWTKRTIAAGGVGEFTSIDVADAEEVLVATEWAQGFDSATRLYATVDGGAHWSHSTVDSFGWYTGVGSSGAGVVWLCYYHPGETDLYTASGPSPAGPWERALLAGAPGDDHYTGIGSSLAVSKGGTVYVSYEDSGSQGSITAVRSTSDSGATWTTSNLGPGGWDTGTEVRRNGVTGRLGVFVSFWQATSATHARVRLGASLDGGATWSISFVPEHAFVAPYLDIAAPTTDVRYVSYMTENQTTFATALRVARVTG